MVPLSNHLHLVARTRPDVVREWSDSEVALRWLRIFPGTRIDEHLADPTTNAVDTLANNADRIQLIRERLSNPSWFMKQAKQVPGTCLDRAVVIC